jgi:hypothetical protein
MIESMRMLVLPILFCGRSTLRAPLLNGKIVDVVRDGVLNRRQPCLINEVREELQELARFDVFNDPLADWMFCAGVLEGRLLDLSHLNDDLLLDTATRLYSRLLLLYPSWLDLTRVGITHIEGPVEEKPQTRSRKDELVDIMKRRFGLDPRTSDTSADELAAEMLKHEQELAQAR